MRTVLDIKFLRDNADIVRNDLHRRGAVEKIGWVDDVLEYDKTWRKLQTEINALRERRNKLTELIGERRKSGEDAADLMREAEAVPDQIKQLESEAQAYKSKLTDILMRLPNIMHETVPEGKDENDNVEVRRWGKIPGFSFKVRDHIDIGDKLKLIDLERASRVAGARFYYLRDDLVRLNFAIISHALDFIQRKGYRLLQPPYMLRREAVAGAVALSDFEDMIYKIEGEDLYLIATAEHPLLAFHMDDILDGRQLPLRYGGVSPCFRKEAGAHGRDTKGIFRVHQFEKVEQFIFCKPEDSWKEHEELIANAEEFFQQLELPYRIVNVCTGDLGTVAAKKYDLEVWLPGQGKFREAVSCSNCTAYQGVRSNVRYRTRVDEPTQWVHTLNSTFVATERAIIAIMENYQQEDGTVAVPKTLRAYMNGRERIGPVEG